MEHQNFGKISRIQIKVYLCNSVKELEQLILFVNQDTMKMKTFLEYKRNKDDVHTKLHANPKIESITVSFTCCQLCLYCHCLENKTKIINNVYYLPIP